MTSSASKQLWRSTLIVSLYTLISRVLGLIRDMLFAHQFGTTAHLDVFLFANRIPNLFRRICAEGAFSEALVPVLVSVRQREGQTRFKEAVAAIAGVFGFSLCVLTFLGVLLAPAITTLFVPGWWIEFLNGGSDRFSLANQLLRITFPYLWFISMAAFTGSILNLEGRFGVMAFTPVLLNMTLISAAVWLAPRLSIPIYSLAWGVLGGGIIQCLFQLPFLCQRGLLLKPRWGWSDPAVKRVATLMLPGLVGISIMQLAAFLNSVIASFLGTGVLGWLYYAERVIELPQGLMGTAIATVLFPTLARLAQKSKQFETTLAWGIKLILLFSLPTALLVGQHSIPLVKLLYGRGAFSGKAVEQTAALIRVMSFGLVPYLVTRVLVVAYHARQEMRIPVRAAGFAFLVNTICLLSVLSVHVLGFAWALCGTSWANAAYLWFHAEFRSTRRALQEYLKPVLLPLCLAAMLSTWLAQHLFSRVHLREPFEFLSISALSCVIYLATLWFVFRLRPIDFYLPLEEETSL